MMAIPRDSTMIEMMLRQAERQPMIDLYNELYSEGMRRWTRQLLADSRLGSLIFRVRRAPQTDDMRQMLDDLGIEHARFAPSRQRLVIKEWSWREIAIR